MSRGSAVLLVNSMIKSTTNPVTRVALTFLFPAATMENRFVWSAMPEGKGLLIVYTGPGKGKTTCALGTAFRAVGQGLRVLMVQFIKGSWHYGELDAAKMLGDDKFEIRPMGRGFVKVGGADTDPEDVRLCEQAWDFGREQIYSEKYDLVVLDEINYVISYKMLDPESVVEVVAEAPRARPRDLHGAERASEARRGGRPRHGDARSEASLHERHPRAARDRLLAMAWFKREKKPIENPTPVDERRVRTEGLWTKCNSCGAIIWKKDLEANWEVCPKCDYHFRLGARRRLDLLLR